MAHHKLALLALLAAALCASGAYASKDECAPIPAWGQCGGTGGICGQEPEHKCGDLAYPGCRCAEGYECTRKNEWYYQCVPCTAPTPSPPAKCVIPEWGECKSHRHVQLYGPKSDAHMPQNGLEGGATHMGNGGQGANHMAQYGAKGDNHMAQYNGKDDGDDHAYVAQYLGKSDDRMPQNNDRGGDHEAQYGGKGDNRTANYGSWGGDNMAQGGWKGGNRTAKYGPEGGENVGPNGGRGGDHTTPHGGKSAGNMVKNGDGKGGYGADDSGKPGYESGGNIAARGCTCVRGTRCMRLGREYVWKCVPRSKPSPRHNP